MKDNCFTLPPANVMYYSLEVYTGIPETHVMLSLYGTNSKAERNLDRDETLSLIKRLDGLLFFGADPVFDPDLRFINNYTDIYSILMTATEGEGTVSTQTQRFYLHDLKHFLQRSLVD